MDMFRAVPRTGFKPGKAYGWRPGQRLPGNVPYLIDNLWEYARPAELVSRRGAVFASPTPQLALAGASAGALAQDEYLACRVVLARPAPSFQLSVRDARYHDDVKALQALVHDALGNWGERDIGQRLVFASLFLPGTAAADLQRAMEAHPELQAVVRKAAAAVRLWHDEANLAEGEIMFELARDNSYTLEPV